MPERRVPEAQGLLVPRRGMPQDAVRGLAGHLLDNPVTRALLDLLPGRAVILDRDRRVVAARPGVLGELGLAGPGGLGGLCPGGCLWGPPAEEGCRERLFRVRSSPFRLAGRELHLVVFQEAAEDPGRDGLDQVFLHDLLNLAGSLEHLVAGLEPRPDADPEGALAGIRALGRQLVEAIQSQRSLFWSGSARRAGQVQATRPADILDRLRRIFSAPGLVAGRRLEFREDGEGPFPCDRALLTRVLLNLVKNALEATPPGGTVKVWHERRDGRRGFVVENPGRIPSEVAGRIFERSFSTKDGRCRGLGTYGAKLLGEQFLGGEVGFASQGDGTRFFIWMPEAPNAPAGRAGPVPAGPATAPGPAGAGTVLVVDDSASVRHLLASLLGPGHRVLGAGSGAEGLALAQLHQPDLVLLDVMMPDMDGFTVCRRLKEDSRTREIPVLFLTALAGEREEMRALEAGGIDFLPKPISPLVLAARVRNQLELKHRQDRLRALTLLDGLTGIANRRRFDQYLELEWQRCSRSGQPLSLVMGDVDFFKAFNDGYGHARGDECLQEVARVFGRALRRPADLAARYGGEEFVCVLPETDGEGARIVADQIQAQLAQLAMPHPFSPVAPRVTVSVGVATADRPVLGRSWRGLVEEADRHMYLAKAHGRNRIEGGPCP